MGQAGYFMGFRWPFSWRIKTVGSEVSQNTNALGAQQMPVGSGPVKVPGVIEGSQAVYPLGNMLGLYPILEPTTDKEANVLGTWVDSQPQPFPTVPAGFNANSHYYPGLARSLLGASYVETPMHRQVVYETSDIPSVQLTVRGAISPRVLQQWQLSQTLAASLPQS